MKESALTTNDASDEILLLLASISQKCLFVDVNIKHSSSIHIWSYGDGMLLYPGSTP